MKQKVKRTLNVVCSLDMTLERLNLAIEYARKQIPAEVKSSDVWLSLRDDGGFQSIIAEYESLETDHEQEMREQEEEFFNQFMDAKKKHLTSFVMDCEGSPEKVSIAARLVTNLHHSQRDCIVYSAPVFADELCEKQTGIEVTISYYGEQL